MDDSESDSEWRMAKWRLMVDALFELELWKLQQHVFWHFVYARRGLPRNGFVLDMFARTFRVQGIFARATPAGLSDHVRAPETIQQLQATNQQVEPGGQQTPAPRQHVQAPRPDDLSADLLAEVGLLLGTARRGSAGQ